MLNHHYWCYITRCKLLETFQAGAILTREGRKAKVDELLWWWFLSLPNERLTCKDVIPVSRNWHFLVFMFSFGYIIFSAVHCFQPYKFSPWNNKQLLVGKELTMKMSSISSLRRIQFLKLGKRIASAGSAITLGGSVKRRTLLDCCHGAYALRQLAGKFKSQWKQTLGWQRSRAQYSYDLHSYSLNFDDGDRLWHHGCPWFFFFFFF